MSICYTCSRQGWFPDGFFRLFYVHNSWRSLNIFLNKDYVVSEFNHIFNPYFKPRRSLIYYSQLLLILFLAFQPIVKSIAQTTDDVFYQGAGKTLDAWMEAQKDFERLPGISAAVISDQEIVWSGAWGKQMLKIIRPCKHPTGLVLLLFQSCLLTWPL